MHHHLTNPNLSMQVEAEQTHLRLPSRPEWIQPAAEYLKDKAVLCGACLAAQGTRLTIALLEALSNAVMHGNLEISSELKEQGDNTFAEALAARVADPHYAARCVDVVVDYDGERCQWSFTDEGPGFDFHGVLKRIASDTEQLLLASGRGILMMRTFLDEVRYEEGGRRAILTLRKPAGGEKRRQPRTPVRQRLRVAPIRPDGTVDWDAAYEAVSRNVSSEGVALLQQQLAATDRIIIAIDTEGGPLYLPAEVRHWRSLGGNLVELGCRFPDQASPVSADMASPANKRVEEIIGDLIKRLPEQEAVDEERRSHTRVTYTERVEIRWRGEETTPQRGSPEEAAVGFARDLSRSGISLITSTPVPLAAAVLALPQGKDQPRLHVQVQVVRCGKIMGGFYDVAARFLGVEEKSGLSRPADPGGSE